MQWSAVWLAVNHWNKISLDLSVENAGWQVTKMSMIYLSVCVTSCIQIFGLSSTWTQNEIKQQQKKKSFVHTRGTEAQCESNFRVHSKIPTLQTAVFASSQVLACFIAQVSVKSPSMWKFIRIHWETLY